MTPDPLDALRQPNTPVDPPAEFADRLRSRLATALTEPDPDQSLDPDPRSISMTDTTTVTTTLAPYLIVADGAAALAFYREAFGAEESFRLDMPDGRIGHAEMRIGASEFALADEYPEEGIVGPATLGGTSVGLRLEVPDVDAVVAAAVAAGAILQREVADQFYGSRAGTIIDPFGHRWNVATQIEDVSIDEMKRRLADGEA